MSIKLQGKPKLEKVSPANWIVANSAIMQALMDDPPVSFMAKDYLQYTRMVGELAARFTWQSVLVFDDEYRVRQAAQGFPWGTDAPHLSTVVLRDRALQQANNSNANKTSKQQGRRPVGQSGKELCLQYNAGNCTYGARCRLEHACSQCGSKDHPARDHRDAPGAATATATPPAGNSK